MHRINAIIKFNTSPQIPYYIKNAFIQKPSKHIFCLLLKIKDYEKLFNSILNRVCKKEGIYKFDKNNVKTNTTMACRKRVHKFYYTFYRNFSQYNNYTTPHNNKNNKIYLTNDFLNMNSLKNEISNIHEKLTENSFIDKKKEEIYFLLKNAIFPNLKGKIYFIGSCENNIWIKNSDIDSCIVVENCEDKNSYLYILKVIKSAINLIHPSLTVNIIKASVPIAKIYKDQTNICDISINNTVAIVNTHLVSCLCNIDERVPIINRIIKYWAKQKNINNRSQGTFSSYALFLLTYFFFQNLETPILPPYNFIRMMFAKME
ncbi:hypothetical protein [Plasmodium yoelii yoelii]|uniref:Poly(A) RNA polymerase mitochondrial-like central palm domain-containing protein n=1 Tax=Plasmodium yoelii yoelii TaxID=73239 RepID=Q7RFK1_PLAYO|nr:hypothetical protein [Plasmodium yoelii yoelii]